MEDNLHQKEFLRRLRTNVEKISDNYAVLLKAGHISDSTTENQLEQLQTGVYTSNIIHSCESLLQMVQELRVAVLFLDQNDHSESLTEESKALRDHEQEEEIKKLNQTTKELINTLTKSIAEYNNNNNNKDEEEVVRNVELLGDSELLI